MTKIFATGVTGYLGGDAIYAILKAHPEYEVTCLVRDEGKSVKVAAAHPQIRIVHGDLNDLKLVEEEAAQADIVCNFAHATHEPSAQALARGLARRSAPGLGFLIHTMGSGTMIYDDVVNNRYGHGTSTVFNDVEGLPEVLAVPDFAQARGAENAVRAIGIQAPERVRTAVVSTGSAYGLGRGIVRYRSTAIHQLVRCTLQRGHAVQVGEGKAAWRHVHVHDLSGLYLKLVEHAAAGGNEAGDGLPVWGGPDGFYFAENGEHVWGELGRLVSDEASSRGLITPAEAVSIGPTEAASLATMGQFFWGCNCRVEGRRAKQALGWRPSGVSLQEEIKAIVTAEARSLGLLD
ncbi:hypothetical protein OIDMADRAFT_35073 [Oidiodendron maius Zn]|uniref:NAD-dependent epimerase/dehydratase domain-containing protein n=1 Tax=Oidiodendron maius (strain Zn) TaxID=913774 RepID=A0A0C3CWD2_OIDMZ|nr:hypothetical protein OIDMADRAFT_35073 [Oidiodendron maius Zn]